MKTVYDLVEFEAGGYGVRRTRYSFFGFKKTEDFASLYNYDIWWSDPGEILQYCVCEKKQDALKKLSKVQLKYKVITDSVG